MRVFKMNKKTFRQIALKLFLVGFSIVFVVRVLKLYFGITIPHMEVVLYIEVLLFFLSITFFLYSFSFESSRLEAKRNDVWKCQSCNETVNVSQIKFGLCPKCGVKLKGFKAGKYMHEY
jgi:predicted RNA-binding Zn-ribbon protein involved in translation (DUF1610 family)